MMPALLASKVTRSKLSFHRGTAKYTMPDEIFQLLHNCMNTCKSLQYSR